MNHNQTFVISSGSNVFSAFLGNAQAVQKAVSDSINAPRCDTQAGDDAEGDSYFDAGKIESKLTPKCAKELVGKDVVCKGRRVSHMHKLNSTVVQGYSTVLA